MKFFLNNLTKNDIFVISGYGPFIFIRPSKYGFLWHTAVRPSVHASYDNISHLFPLLLIGHVVTYIVLIKGEASERCDYSQFGKRQFSYIQLIGLKKCRILITVLTLGNRPSIVIKEGGVRIMAQLFILSYSDAVSFRDIRGHLGTIPSIVTFYICVCRRRRL